MKKCPFCAEEIRDEAIKCRYCQSFLSMAPAGGEVAARPDPEPAGKPEPAPAREPAQERAPAAAEPAAAQGPPEKRGEARSGARRERKVLYQGSPSWRAFFGEYFFIVVGMVLVPVLSTWVAGELEAELFTKVLAAAIPVALAIIFFFAVNIYRKSKIYRITSTNIETEYGLISKKIDVLELWRCRDVRFRQSIFDRMLGIAHIEVFTTDVTTPNLCLLGLPGSRHLFEQIRDSIEIQRHSRNVVGLVE